MSGSVVATLPSAIYVESKREGTVLSAHVNRSEAWRMVLSPSMARSMSETLLLMASGKAEGRVEYGETVVYAHEGGVVISSGNPPVPLAMGLEEARILAGMLAQESQESDFATLMEAIDRAWDAAHAAAVEARRLADSLPKKGHEHALALSMLSDIAAAEVILAQAASLEGWREGP